MSPQQVRGDHAALSEPDLVGAATAQPVALNSEPLTVVVSNLPEFSRHRADRWSTTGSDCGQRWRGCLAHRDRLAVDAPSAHRQPEPGRSFPAAGLVAAVTRTPADIRPLDGLSRSDLSDFRPASRRRLLALQGLRRLAAVSCALAARPESLHVGCRLHPPIASDVFERLRIRDGAAVSRSGGVQRRLGSCPRLRLHPPIAETRATSRISWAIMCSRRRTRGDHVTPDERRSPRRRRPVRAGPRRCFARRLRAARQRDLQSASKRGRAIQ